MDQGDQNANQDKAYQFTLDQRLPGKPKTVNLEKVYKTENMSYLITRSRLRLVMMNTIN